jgi:hypothetical protein
MKDDGDEWKQKLGDLLDGRKKIKETSLERSS